MAQASREIRFRIGSDDAELPPAERVMPVHGVSVAYLSDVGSRAAKAAHAKHVKTRRLQPSAAKRGGQDRSR